MKIAIVSATGIEANSISRSLEELKDVEVVYKIPEDLKSERDIASFKKELESSSFFIAILHGGEKSIPNLRNFADFARERGIPTHVQGTSNDPDEISISRDLSTYWGEEKYEIISKYINFSGKENFKRLFLYLKGEYNPPLPAWDHGIYLPHLSHPLTLDEYTLYLKDKDGIRVGIIFYKTYFIEGNLEHIDALIKEIESQKAIPFPVFTGENKGKTAESFFIRDGKPIIDVLISTMPFSIRIMDRRGWEVFVDKLGIPVIHATSLLRSFKDWCENPQGASPIDISIHASQPELDGFIITTAFSTRELIYDEKLGGSRVVYKPIPDRVKKIVSLAINWGKIRRKPNHEKKIAILFHNYPPRNDNIGSAFGLDSFSSVNNLLKLFKEQGIRVEKIYENGDELAKELLSHTTNERRWLPPKDLAEKACSLVGEDSYNPWFKELPDEVKETLKKYWGDPPGDIFTYNGNFIINGFINGNVYIGIQPPRGRLEDISKIHDPYMPPTYHYLAHYRFIKHIFKADMIFHIGKHGSLEWLPGKSFCLSNRCFPDLSIMDIPHFYPYIVNNPGEGTQAKRRSHACILDHLTPPFRAAGLYSDLLELERLIDEYRELELKDKKKLPYLRERIWKLVESMHLHKDLDLSEDNLIERLHSYLSEIKNTIINDGLHTFGEPPAGERLINFVSELLLLENKVDAPRDALHKALSMYIQGVDPLFSFEKAFEEANVSISKDTLRKISSAAVHIIEKLKTSKNELHMAERAINGFFIPPGPSGCPTRGRLDVLPTGRNFYSLDPYMVPTESAWEFGKRLGDKLIERYLKEEGKYPEAVTMVVWASPTMRTGGDDIAEALYLLGVKPIWNKNNGRVEGVEVIPVKKLGRPRIDVTLVVSGLFRDTFPNVMELYDEAVRMVALLDEDEDVNFLRKSFLSDLSYLLKKGLGRKDAERIASVRVFSEKPGTYGIGVNDILYAKCWKERKELGEIFVEYGGYGYGKEIYGIDGKEIFKRRLIKTEVALKNMDSREMDLLSCDDYNAYLGGLMVAVKTLKGDYPRAYASDNSDPSEIKVRSVDEEIKLIFRARVLNPKWIEGMKKHGYKGAGDLSSLVDYVFQWDATSDVIEKWMYDELSQKYALDKEIQDFFKKHNPYALQNIAERLLEAAKRGFWKPDKKTLRELENILLEMEGEIEEMG